LPAEPVAYKHEFLSISNLAVRVLCWDNYLFGHVPIPNQVWNRYVTHMTDLSPDVAHRIGVMEYQAVLVNASTANVWTCEGMSHDLVEFCRI